MTRLVRGKKKQIHSEQNKNERRRDQTCDVTSPRLSEFCKAIGDMNVPKSKVHDLSVNLVV